jgi:penicillin-binding protein 1A
VQAILAIEDQRFYDHAGFDLVRVAGAALNNVVEGRFAQGGSTLTQQLARQSSPHTRQDARRRKLTEVLVATRLERQFTKDEILSLYLNKVYFGDGLYGVEAASLGYFNKHAADVSLEEAALPRRARQGAVDVCAHGEPRTSQSPSATSCFRRCTTRR